jgi:hypothetical protein
MPPLKSEVPKETAEDSPKTTVANPDESGMSRLAIVS